MPWAFRKKVMLYGCSLGLVVSVLSMADDADAVSLLSVPSVVGNCLMLCSLFVEDRFNVWAAEAAVYLIGVSALLNDWNGARLLINRTWAIVVLLLDVALITKLHPRVTRNLVSAGVVWHLFLSTEDTYRWGLYDIGSFSENVESCACKDPPCALSIGSGISTAVTNITVFLLDFYFTRGFAHGMQKEHEKMEAAINATERIASSLSDFDLTAAEATLELSILPPPLHDAFIKILGNLERYRPYLPDALFGETDSIKPPDVEAPGQVTGRAALVFTDIQGSTATWEVCPEEMREGLHVHNKVIRECLSAHGGYEVKTIGDSFMVAFGGVMSAVQFGVCVQESLLRAAWPISLKGLEHCAWSDDGLWCGLRVRIGVHCGEVDVQVNPLTGRCDYFGNTVNKAARMEGVCAAGAVAVTQEVIEGAELGDIVVLDMGEIELKGVQGGVLSYLLLPSSLAGRRECVEGQIAKVKEANTTSLNSLGGSVRSEGLLSSRVATVCVAEAAVEGYGDVEVVMDKVNSVLAKVSTSSERTHGTVVSLQGSRVAVCWNGAKPCVTHVENAMAFTRMVGIGRSLFLGVATGGVVCGTVGVRRQKFVAVLGVGMEVAARLCTDAVQASVLCYYAMSEALPATCVQRATQLGLVAAPDGTMMRLYEVVQSVEPDDIFSF